MKRKKLDYRTTVRVTENTVKEALRKNLLPRFRKMYFVESFAVYPNGDLAVDYVLTNEGIDLNKSLESNKDR